MRSAILAFLLLVAPAARALTVASNVPLGNLTCDTVTWTDRNGQPRTIWMVNDEPQGDSYLKCGGHVQRLEWFNGTNAQAAFGNNDNLGGFGVTVNHGWYDGTEFGIAMVSRPDGYDPQSRFLFVGPHHAIWELRCKLGIKGHATTPYVNYTFTRIVRDGEDQWQELCSFDARHVGITNLPSGDSRTPYCNAQWSGNPDYMIISGFGYGTTHRCIADPNTQTYDARPLYGLVPFVESWCTKPGYDHEFGMIATRLLANHSAGRNAGVNGTQGPFPNADGFDFQFSDYQGWWGERTCWHASQPDGQGQAGVTAGTENYSLSMIVDARTTGGVSRLVDEANAIMNDATTLTVLTGRIATAGLEVNGLDTVRTWDKPGFDQAFRTWTLHAKDNDGAARLVVQPNRTLINPTFVLRDYTATNPPSIRLNGAALPTNELAASVRAEEQEGWVTLLKPFAGTNVVTMDGPPDHAPDVLRFDAQPSFALLGTSTTIRFTLHTDGVAATLDLSGLGGGHVAMPADGDAFACAWSTPINLLEGDKFVRAMVTDADGHRRLVQTTVLVKKPDLVVYAQAETNAGPSWGFGAMVETVEDAPFEGTRHFRYTYGGGGDVHGIGFPPRDIRRMTHLVLSVRGAVAGQTNLLQLRSAGNWGSDWVPLVSTTNYRVLAIPMADLFQTTWIETDQANEVRIQGEDEGGAVFVDWIRFTSEPPAQRAAPALATEPVTGQPVLRLPARAGLRHIIQHRTSLDSGNWTEAEAAMGEDAPIIFMVEPGFYRVEVHGP